jgi:hypothetical protein
MWQFAAWSGLLHTSGASDAVEQYLNDRKIEETHSNNCYFKCRKFHIKSIWIEPEAQGEKPEYYHLNYGITTHCSIWY